MGEVRLGRLRVVESSVTHGAPGGSEGQRAAVKQVSTAVSVLGGLVDNLDTNPAINDGRHPLLYLVKCREDVVGKLDLCDGVGPGHGETDSEASDALLTQGSVEDSLFPVLLGQTHGTAEHSTEGHVLSEYAGGVVGGQSDVQTVGDGLEKCHLLCRSWNVILYSRSSRLGHILPIVGSGMEGTNVKCAFRTETVGDRYTECWRTFLLFRRLRLRPLPTLVAAAISVTLEISACKSETSNSVTFRERTGF